MFFKRGALSNWAYLPYYSYFKALDSLATTYLPPEKWSYADKEDYGILQNYLNYTFEKLWNERSFVPKDNMQKYVYEGDTAACFNTGLFDKNWQPIYFCCVKNPNEGQQTWMFKCFCNSYEISLNATDLQPSIVSSLRRANYFVDPSALIFNVNLDIIPQWDHILDNPENFKRIPSQLQTLGRGACQNIIEGAITKVKNRIAANYKTVVPQYFRDKNNDQGKIQLLAPLYLTNDNKPDLALVLSLSKDKTLYYGHTCLTTEMAYNNARLIAKPDSDWLIP